MASTKTPQQALDYAVSFLKQMPLATQDPTVAVEILDQVGKRMWMAAPWRWTVGSLPQKALATNTPDYTVTLPSDFLYGLEAKVADPANYPYRDLEIVPDLPTNGILKGNPSQLAITGAGANGLYRISPIPGTVASGATIIGEYKKIAPTVTEEDLEEPILVFPDEWFWVYCLGVMAYAWTWGDDQRGGSGNMASNKQYGFNGYFGMFESALEQMREREKLPLAQVRTVPVPKQEKG